jgi:DNA-binding HxlR family transcriptional regulator
MDDTESVAPETRLPVWCPGEEWCAITATTSLIGRKWHPVIIHRLLAHGPLGFNDLQEEVDGVSGKVLSESLEDLQEKQLVTREVKSEKPVRVEYDLTDLGRSLRPVVEEVAEWGSTYLDHAESEGESVV